MALRRRPAITLPVTIGSEVERWIQEPNLLDDCSYDEIKAYMLSKRVEFLIITQMARDFQAIPATSGPSERQFSYAGNLITKKRTRIASENVRYVLCLRSWGLLPDSDDEKEMVFDEKGALVRVVQQAVVDIIE